MVYFNPRSPYGERHFRLPAWCIPADFNPRSPYGERLRRNRIMLKAAIISIHAPLTGSDFRTAENMERSHSFQSTLPLRGATVLPSQKMINKEFQSTLPLRGATVCRWIWRRQRPISIHAPLTGSDRSPCLPCSEYADFNPRSPYGERLELSYDKQGYLRISIHAPLTGSDAPSRLK